MAYKLNVVNVRTNKMKPLGVVIHNDAGGVSGFGYINALKNHRLENGFAHHYISEGEHYQAMYNDHVAWHTGNQWGNGNLIGFEVCQSMTASNEQFLRNEEETFRIAAEIMVSWGIPINENTVFLHKELSATACPHRSWDLHGKSIASVKKYFVERIKHYANGGNKTAAKPAAKPTPKPASKKSNEVIAKEVIAGKWGSGEQRKRLLSSAGYNYGTIQGIVNTMLGQPKPAARKSNEVIAREVIAGNWGNDPQRSQKLRAAGYDPNAIQNLVNRML